MVTNRDFLNAQSPAELAALSDQYMAEQMAKHWSDRDNHKVIARNGNILSEAPEYEDNDGVMQPTKRRISDSQTTKDLGREYHIGAMCDERAQLVRLTLILGFRLEHP